MNNAHIIKAYEGNKLKSRVTYVACHKMAIIASNIVRRYIFCNLPHTHKYLISTANMMCDLC